VPEEDRLLKLTKSIASADSCSQSAVVHSRIHLRRRNLPMPQRPLDQVQVPGLVVEPGGEGVPHGMDGDATGQAGNLAGLGEP